MLLTVVSCSDLPEARFWAASAQRTRQSVLMSRLGAQSSLVVSK
jgi:hypothetical protein